MRGAALKTMNKELILLTVPHTGTHTMHYLFSVLAGVKVWWSHFEEKDRETIEWLKNIDWSNYVFATTYRTTESTVQSYMRRHPEAPQLDYLRDCLNMRCAFQRQFPMAGELPIEAHSSVKTAVAMDIFMALNQYPNDEALSYMNNWKAVNSWVGKHDHKGLKDEEERIAVTDSISRGHLRKLKEEMGNGT